MKRYGHLKLFLLDFLNIQNLDSLKLKLDVCLLRKPYISKFQQKLKVEEANFKEGNNALSNTKTKIIDLRCKIDDLLKRGNDLLKCQNDCRIMKNNVHVFNIQLSLIRR